MGVVTVRQRGQGLFQRLYVDLAHQTPDVLVLPRQRSTALETARLFDGIDQ